MLNAAVTGCYLTLSCVSEEKYIRTLWVTLKTLKVGKFLKDEKL